jgi:phosphomannomutase
MPTETPIDRLSSFRLGDVRGIYPNEINEDFVHKFAQSLVGLFNLKGKIVTGRDMRASSAPLQQALNSSLKSIGINVIDIGLVPTELGYFASAQPGIEAAIIVTASHNPSNYNGLKCVLKKGEAITIDTGLNDIKSKMLEGYQHPIKAGSIEQQDFRDSYVAFLETQFQQDQLAGGRIALNGLNGTAATMAGSIGDRFSIDRTWFRKEPGPIPSQGADPVNPKLAKEMKDYMTPHEFDLGVAWDGDCDRCVFFDASGDLIPTNYFRYQTLLEHDRYHQEKWGCTRACENRSRLHETAHASKSCELWWRTLSPSLLRQLLWLRLWHVCMANPTDTFQSFGANTCGDDCRKQNQSLLHTRA